MIEIKHSVSFLPFRHQHDLVLQKVLWKDKMQELNEGLPVIDKILLALVHLNELVLNFLKLLLGSLQLLGLLFEQLDQGVVVEALVLADVGRRFFAVLHDEFSYFIILLII